MRKLLFALALGLGCSAFAFPRPPVPQLPKNYREDLIPWPWGAEAEFPWRLIDGFWMTGPSATEAKFFLFRTTYTQGSVFLQIDQVDPVTCKTMGRGYMTPSGRILRGRLALIPAGARLLELRSFPENSVLGDHLPPALEGNRLVLSSAALGGTDVHHLALRRISPSLLSWCVRPPR